jgi:hypothetical protein
LEPVIRHRTSYFPGPLHSGTNDGLKTAVLVPRSEANRETPSTQRKKTTAKILKGRKEKGKAVKNESALRACAPRRSGQEENFLRKCAKRLFNRHITLCICIIWILEVTRMGLRLQASASSSSYFVHGTSYFTYSPPGCPKMKTWTPD